jgi:hypothetical protein
MDLGREFKGFSVGLGFVCGPVIALFGLLNSDLPYAGLVMGLGVVIFLMALSINATLERENPEEENPEDPSE